VKPQFRNVTYQQELPSPGLSQLSVAPSFTRRP